MDPVMGGAIGTGIIYGIGPWPNDPKTEEYIFMTLQSMDDLQGFSLDQILQRIRNSLQVPDLPIDLLSLSHWALNSIVVQRYRSNGGRIFLVSDSAHQMPPWGPRGINTGFSDALNLVWKIAFTLRLGDHIDLKHLLDTYDHWLPCTSEPLGV
jgi:2-polyprenyl-6-methoxyphenol hydroxylase-like FAD-dependent oxidoreductase